MTPTDAKTHEEELRLNFYLKGEDAAKLKRLAAKARTRPGQFAKTLLGAALDKAEAEA